MEDLILTSFSDGVSRRFGIDSARPDDNIAEFYRFLHNCYKCLFELDPREFVYPSSCNASWDIEAIKDANERLIDDLTTDCESVYVIYSYAENDSIKRKKYVGTTKDLKERIQQHFIRKSEDTASHLERIRNAVRRGERVYVAWITITPTNLCYCVEQAIITIEKTMNQQALPWNAIPNTRRRRSRNPADSNHQIKEVG